MWALPLPDNKDSLDELVTALTYKNGSPKYSLSEQDIIAIEKIYSRYETQQGKPHIDLLAAGILSEHTLKAIYDGYSEIQERGRLHKLRSRLMLATDRCPCCGIGAVTDLDHHLPRSTYKAISVYSSNLVPLCHKCNNKKRTVAGSTPDDSFIHVYYDAPATEERFFIANTEIVNNALRVDFEVVKTRNMSDESYKMIKFQIKRVNLNTRLQMEINTFLCSYYVGLEMAYGDDANSDAVKELLLSNEKHFITNMGLNDWRSSLLASLAQNNDFCDSGFIRALGST